MLIDIIDIDIDIDYQHNATVSTFDRQQALESLSSRTLFSELSFFILLGCIFSIPVSELNK